MENKRKIIFVCNRILNYGGIETSLIRFANVLSDDDRNEVTVLLVKQDNELLKRFSSKVNISFISFGDPKSELLHSIKSFKIKDAIAGIIKRYRFRKEKHHYAKEKCWYDIVKNNINIQGAYDCAIAYSTSFSDLSIVIDKVTSRKKVAFLHSNPSLDVEKTGAISDKLLCEFDKIYCVSEKIRELYCQVHPSSAEKADVMYNIIDSNEIVSMASQEITDVSFDTASCNLITVGRFEKLKGQQLALDIVPLLNKAGYNVKWYFIGVGPTFNEIKEKVVEKKLSDQIFILGLKDNPYKYVKACDIYVQPTYTEAFCTTTREAKVLCKPVVTTDVPGMREQFESGVNGLIVETGVDGLYYGIKRLLDEPELCRSFVERLKTERPDNSAVLEKLYRFIG